MKHWMYTKLQRQDLLVKASSWVNELRQKAGDDNLVIHLVGNKVDLVLENPDKRAVSMEYGTNYARDKNLILKMKPEKLVTVKD